MRHQAVYESIPIGSGTIRGAQMGGNRATIGLYGMETRHRTYSVGLRADFVFNGLGLCLEQCLRGLDTLLICDEDCLGVIRSRVESLRYFGSTVDIQVVGRS